MTFQDIFKSSFLENVTGVSILDMAVALALAFGLGLFIFLCSFVMLGYSLVQHFLGNTISGWTSLIVSIWAIGGLQLLAIGIVGEYIGKIYMETKERPKFIIEKTLDTREETAGDSL